MFKQTTLMFKNKLGRILRKRCVYKYAFLVGGEKSGKDIVEKLHNQNLLICSNYNTSKNQLQ